jgi:copper(I)-binding protein
MVAGFGRIENHCPNPVTITGVSSPAFGDASMHETASWMASAACASCRTAHRADGAAVLKPGGMHLMLMQPRTELKEGSRVAVEFSLKDGRVLRGELEVRKP